MGSYEDLNVSMSLLTYRGEFKTTTQYCYSYIVAIVIITTTTILLSWLSQERLIYHHGYYPPVTAASMESDYTWTMHPQVHLIQHD